MLARDRELRKQSEPLQNLSAVGDVAAGKFSYNPRMHTHAVLTEQRDKMRMSRTEMVNPDGGIDENHLPVCALNVEIPPARNVLKIGFRTAKPGQADCALALDERFKSGTNQRPRLLKAAQLPCIGQQVHHLLRRWFAWRLLDSISYSIKDADFDAC